MNATTKVRIPSHVDATWIEEGYVLLNRKRGVYYSLDGVGSTIWSLLAEGSPLDAVVARLTRKYSVDEHRARQDVAELLSRLVEAGLVEPLG